MSNAPDIAPVASVGSTPTVKWLETWKLKLQRRFARQSLRADALIHIAEFSGRPINSMDQRNAQLLLRNAILPSSVPGEHDAALLLAITGTVLHGEECHVLSAGNAAYGAAERWAPLFHQMGVSFVRLDLSEPSRGRKAQVVFGTVRDVGLAWLRQSELDKDQPGPLQQLARRIAPGTGKSALPHGRLSFARAIVLDADEAMARTSLGGIVGTRREEREDMRREFIQDAFGLAAQLRAPADFTRAETGITLTPEGRKRAQALSRLLGESWNDPITTEFLVLTALETLVLWRRDADYHVTGEQIEVLSPSLALRLRGANPGISVTDMIAVREAPQDNRPTGRPTNRTSVRSLLLRYDHLCGLARHLGRYAAELHAAYGVNVRTSRIAVLPDEITKDAKDLVERARKLVDAGQICIVESCADAESDAIRDIFMEAGIPLITVPDWPQPDLDLPDGGVLWALPKSNDQMIERFALDPRAAMEISLSGADFRSISSTAGLVRLALIRTISGAAEISLIRRAANLTGLRQLTATARWRALQMAANDRDAFMRQQLFTFDQHCRRVVDFAQTARNTS